jgi:hypothetical protein
MRRDEQAREPEKGGRPLGAPPPAALVLGRPVPYQPDMPVPQQYQPPNNESQMLLRSYARHVLQLPWPEHPNAKPQAVKIYRVLHRMLSAPELGMGIDPRNPRLYIPVYMGEYNPAGELVDDSDPLLYWILPIIPDPQENGVLNAYVFLHAGDREHWKLRGPFGGRLGALP